MITVFFLLYPHFFPPSLAPLPPFKSLHPSLLLSLLPPFLPPTIKLVLQWNVSPPFKVPLILGCRLLVLPPHVYFAKTLLMYLSKNLDRFQRHTQKWKKIS